MTWRGRADAGEVQALHLLVPFIDVALRRMAPQPAVFEPRTPGMPACAVRHEGHDGRTALATLVPPHGSLSERERQIMGWVAMGKTNPEIGCILRISEFTVKNHMKSIFSKLDVTNRAQAVAMMTRLPAHA